MSAEAKHTADGMRMALGETVLLTMVMPEDISQRVQDLLLAQGDLVRGFTAGHVEGHGLGVELVEPAELVAGHAPRTVIRTVGPEAALRQVLGHLKQKFPGANVFYWLVPVLEAGQL